MLILNPDQLKVKQQLKTWWTSPDGFAVLEGPAGTGKTFIVNELVKELINCVPLFTAPTNEACKQLEMQLPKDSVIKTTYAALGFHFSSGKEVKELVRKSIPPIINDVNLMIVDEASMIGDGKNCIDISGTKISIFDAIKQTGLKVLFIGHRSQLPEVVVNQSIFADCLSPVFHLDCPIYTLAIPQRNTGDLFKFLTHLESIIYAKHRIFIAEYNNSREHLTNYINSPEGKNDFLEEKVKVICYTNKQADEYNRTIRRSIFSSKYLPEVVPRDRLLLVTPLKYIGNLDNINESLVVQARKRNNVVVFSANSKCVVKHVEQVIILGVACYKLNVDMEGNKINIYVAIDKEQLYQLRQLLLQKAYTAITPQAKQNRFELYHFIMSLFADVKYSYAITTHRAQGMSIEKVFVDWKDIKKCSNVILMYKLLYVAASRARTELNIIGD